MARKILLTGSSGYIGGSVLHELKTRNAVLQMNVKPIHFDGLHDLESNEKAASEHDIVISRASSMDEASCVALIRGLGERKLQHHGEVYHIHTSGTSNFGDHPISGTSVDAVRSDEDGIFGWEKENAEGWITRAVDVAAINAGEEFDVRTAIVNPPIIYGKGTGPPHQTSIQIPALIKVSLHFKQAVVVGDGQGVWNYIHINDVSSFYCHLVQLILDNRPLKFGKTGYYFPESGEVSWREISERIAEAGFAQGLFEKQDLKPLTTDDLCQAIGISFLNPSMVEVIWASNARITSNSTVVWL
ncbi:uncharacterized protein B0J16DRAFT_389014 [Fusarium flagelliforme]|uniref:uncharacterized protein n=1 Tax=Fusarium flagelliforme TaxID=2675880 RepID=UPI001E8D0A41|nr:uncharacterized protein B0J16DRAFT_389014 [Fusarium flagelliforme]KAH7173127.1 hypothetical protein B0J16DRAFT_389014 [Fusarium flagelliforme]